MDTAGLARAQREAAKSNALAQSRESSNAESSPTTTVTKEDAVSDSQLPSSGSTDGDTEPPQGGAGRLNGAELPAVSEDNVIVTNQGARRDAGQEEEDEEDGEVLDPGAIKLKMLPMGAVGHLGRGDQVGIIRKTVPKEKRMLVLQRLFHLAQGGCLPLCG